MKQTIQIILIYAVSALIIGCTNCSDTTKEVNAQRAWQQYKDARKSKDLERTLVVIDSMEQANIISTAKSDYLKGLAYDQGWQMRIAEHFYKMSYKGYAPNPSQDWDTYTDAGYRWAFLRFARGDTEGALDIVSQLLAQAETDHSFPADAKISLLMLMSDVQMLLHQYDEALLTCQKAYETEQQVDKSNRRGWDKAWLCKKMSDKLYKTGDVEGALEWNDRCAEGVTLAEQEDDDSLLIEEWKGHVALTRALYLQELGHTAEAAAIYAAVPSSRLLEPNGYTEAADYLMAAGRYDEAAYWYEQIDSTYRATDGAQMTFDIIADRISPRYLAYRKAGRDSDALALADSITSSIDSALVWHKKDAAAELAVIYQTHEKELALEESKAQTTVYRILALSLVVILFIIVFALWRLFIAHRRVLLKNRELYEVIQLEQERKENEIERIAHQPEHEHTPNEHLFLRLIELMKKEKPYTDAELNRDTLASMLGTNHRYVDDAIRACSDNQSTNAFINSYRVDHAARLLTDTDEPIAIIAEMSGFANRTTFNEQFRSRYKMTPSEFRQAAKS